MDQFFPIVSYQYASGIVQDTELMPNEATHDVTFQVITPNCVFRKVLCAGNQMISKIASVFKWEEWKLAEEEEK